MSWWKRERRRASWDPCPRRQCSTLAFGHQHLVPVNALPDPPMYDTSCWVRAGLPYPIWQHRRYRHTHYYLHRPLCIIGVHMCKYTSTPKAGAAPALLTLGLFAILGVKGYCAGRRAQKARAVQHRDCWRATGCNKVLCFILICDALLATWSKRVAPSLSLHRLGQTWPAANEHARAPALTGIDLHRIVALCFSTLLP